MYKTFDLLGLSLSVYWTVFALGVLGMLLLNVFRGKKKNTPVWQALLLTLLVIVVSFVGAKILYYIEEPHVLLAKGVRLDGVSFFGSVFFVPLAMLPIAKLCKKPYPVLMDFLSPSLMLMLAVLRIGCYLTGCCEGVMVDAFGESFRFPAQIVECVYDILLMFGLLLYERFWKNQGRLYPFIMVYYGVFRFFLEFLRNTPKEWLGFSHGQWFAVASLAIGSYLLIRMGKKDRKQAKRKITHKKR